MTYLYHLKQTVSGSLPGGEVWSCGISFNYAQTSLVDETALLQFNNLCIARWRAAMLDTDFRFSTGVVALNLVTRAVNPQGKTITLVEGPVVEQGGGGLSPGMPNQIAMVLSLITSVPGAKGRGRLYLPLLGQTVGTNGRVPTANVTAVAGACQELVNGLNTDGAAVYDDDSVYAIVASGVGQGLNSRVDRIRVGDVLDDQRRRRDALQESYRVEEIGG